MKIRRHDSPARRSQNPLHVTSHDDVRIVRGLGDGDVVRSQNPLHLTSHDDVRIVRGLGDSDGEVVVAFRASSAQTLSWRRPIK